ncbi:MACPF domain-containing protein [Caerostris darwini]|uniref:MACPF domain-containing protein n=1 Tax=Caerostris darwini TaxID=1538125 RepID=A0AAV4RMP3_9ARAC|nr:MACPF domain-containing protein [Caerostris darwini]
MFKNLNFNVRLSSEPGFSQHWDFSHDTKLKFSIMTTSIIPVLAAMYLGSTFNLIKYEKGNADVFDEKTLEGNLQVIDRSFTRSQYKLVETSTQAREFLDVSGALSLRIKKGDITVDGTGAYLKDMANRQKFVELLVRVQHETVTETIPSHLKPKTDWMSMSPDSVGTHYVRSITYGGELIASLRLKANNREEREIIKAAVSANLQLTGTFDLNANGSFDKLRKDLAGMYNEEIKIMATKSPSSPPQTVEELMKLVADYPKEIKTIGNGKGKALKAELYPLSSLKSDFPNYLPNSAINSLLNDVETKYDDIRIVMHEIIPWNTKRPDSSEEEDEMVNELWETLQQAQAAFHKAINELDVSITGKITQFNKAFESYGTGKNNTPNRFQRWFWRLKHEITKEPIVWEKPDGSGGVYINWGSDKCRSTSLTNPEVTLLYSGRAAGTLLNAWAGGRNFECMKTTEPQLSRAVATQPKPAYLDAVEYRTLIEPDKSRPIPCAACLVADTVAVKTLYARKTCPRNWKKEYSGVTMADSSSKVDVDFMCLNKEIFEVPNSSEAGSHTAKLNPVWMNCEKCDGEKIVPCVVCSYENKSEMF